VAVGKTASLEHHQPRALENHAKRIDGLAMGAPFSGERYGENAGSLGRPRRAGGFSGELQKGINSSSVMKRSLGGGVTVIHGRKGINRAENK